MAFQFKCYQPTVIKSVFKIRFREENESGIRVIPLFQIPGGEATQLLPPPPEYAPDILEAIHRDTNIFKKLATKSLNDYMHYKLICYKLTWLMLRSVNFVLWVDEILSDRTQTKVNMFNHWRSPLCRVTLRFSKLLIFYHGFRLTLKTKEPFLTVDSFQKRIYIFTK